MPLQTKTLQSIRVRISAVIITGSVCGALIFEFAWVPRLTELIVNAQSREIRREAEILSDGILPYLLSNQIGAAYETLSVVENRYDNWVAVTLYDAEGQVLYPLEDRQPESGQYHVTETAMIAFEGRDLGRLSVVADIEPEILRLRNEVWRIVSAGLGVLALILLGIAFVVDRLFIRRLIQVAHAADELAVGNYELLLPKGDDEIGQLAHRFESMRIRIQDQTDSLREARARAEVALEARSRFLATVSHEIRTPLNGIIPAAELLSDTPLDASQRQKVDIILTSGKALTTIVDDILDVSMFENGKLVLRDAPFSPAEICDDAFEILRANAEAKGLALIKDCTVPADLICRGDANRLRQILINLFGNAVKFTKEGSVSFAGSATETSEDRARLVFEVTDTGIGIETVALPRIFQRFEQADGSMTRRFGGSGLGLSIVKSLVDAMGGTVSVQSVIGVGSTFRVEVELDVTSAPVKHAEEATPEPALIGAGRSALIVDDNEINLTVAAAMLARLGFDVETADTGEAALAKTRDRTFDIIFMDMHMPEMDGLIATRHIRNGPGLNTATKIVALTASVQAEDMEKCRAAGMDTLLAKPLRIDTLQAFLSG